MKNPPGLYNAGWNYKPLVRVEGLPKPGTGTWVEDCPKNCPKDEVPCPHWENRCLFD